MFSINRPFEFVGFEPEFASALGRALSGEPYEVERCWYGGAATFHVLRLTTGRNLLLKRSLPGAKSLSDEIAILERVAVPGSALAVRFPAFHGTIEGFDAFLAEFVPGKTPRELLSGRRAPADLPAKLLDALRHFHEIETNPHGDFHAGNVLVDGPKVTLLDPASPDMHERAPGEHPMATDIGYWIASAAHYLLSDIRRAPKVGWRLFLLNRRILRELSASGDISPSRIHRVAVRQLQPLRRDPSLVSRASYFPALAYVWLLRLSLRTRNGVTPAPAVSPEALPGELPGA